MPTIVRFELSNHRSIKDPNELSFVAARISDEPSHLLPIPGSDEQLLPVIGLYGANASGKSNLLSGLEWGLKLIRDSQRVAAPGEPIARDPFLLDSASRTAPTRWELEFVHDGVRYAYGFAITDRVEEEWLVSYPLKRPRVLFERRADERVKFGRYLTGDRRKAEAFVRPNSLLLSAGAQNNHEVLGGIATALVGGIRLGLMDLRQIQGGLAANADLQSVARLLSHADVGIREVRLQPGDGPNRDIEDLALRLLTEPPTNDGTNVLESLVAPASRQRLQELRLMDGDTVRELLRKANPALFGQLEFGHASADGSLRFLPSDAESLGTIAYLHAGVTAASTLNRGGVLCIDELDTSLHPLLARTLIQWFQSPERNPKGAQLLFTTHDTNLLARGVLRRDQVWFTEKDRGGATQLYPLTRIKTRKGDNLQRGYLEGRFGAIPFITGPDDEVA